MLEHMDGDAPPGGSSATSSDAHRLLPAAFRFGVATAGFQVEGGFNGPGEPANNWVRWEQAGRVEPSGLASGFWDHFEEHLDRAAAMGCDAFRLGVEWARVEPRDGDVDDSALDRYDRILAGCRDRGLEPLVTLHHFTHPAWLGEDFWLSNDSVARYAAWVELAVGRLAPRCRHWVTLNEINAYAIESYVLGLFPPGRSLAFADMVTACDHMLAAHVRAYEIIHRLQPEATVTTNNVAVSVYEFDRVLIDVLTSRQAGISRDEVGGWLQGRRSQWYRGLPAPTATERLIRQLLARPSTAGGPLPKAVDAVWQSPHPCSLDIVGIDYYDPVVSHHVRLPGHSTAGGRSWRPGRELWDDRLDLPGLVTYCRANATGDKALWVVENGMCNRTRRGRSYPRLDGWDRPRYLRHALAAVLDAVDAGLPVEAYYHWSLVDNYEWGSYEPRFGLFGIDRERGNRLLDTDAMGFDAAGAYRRVIQGLRDGDRSVLVEVR